MTAETINQLAERYDLEPFNLRQLVALCPLDDPPDNPGFELSELANLLSDMGEDVPATAALAHRLMDEFGYIPEDSSCVSEGGAQVMYHEIVFGGDE